MVLPETPSDSPPAYADVVRKVTSYPDRLPPPYTISGTQPQFSQAQFPLPAGQPSAPALDTEYYEYEYIPAPLPQQPNQQQQQQQVV